VKIKNELYQIKKQPIQKIQDEPDQKFGDREGMIKFLRGYARILSKEWHDKDTDESNDIFVVISCLPSITALRNDSK
jgi:hypothetical protein